MEIRVRPVDDGETLVSEGAESVLPDDVKEAALLCAVEYARSRGPERSRTEKRLRWALRLLLDDYPDVYGGSDL